MTDEAEEEAGPSWPFEEERGGLIESPAVSGECDGEEDWVAIR